MRAAFYESDITPPLGGFMWGHYCENTAYDVIDRLHAKALVTEDNGEIAAIVCVDTCALPPEMHDIVTKRITEYTGIPAERVCITSNHTHWGAPVSDDNTVGCRADEAYKDVFYRLVADTVTLAYKRLDDAEAGFAVETVSGINFCRNHVLENGKVVTHGSSVYATKSVLAVPDESLAVMTFTRNGKPIGAMINFACHQCCCGSINGYSGDYSSILSDELKKQYGQDFVSLFVLGTCGDLTHVNSVDRSSTKERQPGWYREMGRRIAEKAKSAIENAAPANGGVSVRKEMITLQKRTAELSSVKERLGQMLESDAKLMRLRNTVYYEATNKEKTADLWLQVIRIGDVCIYCMPGEVFVNHGYRLKAQSSFEKSFVIENCNSYCGYIPTKEAFDERCDLYETSLCHHSCLEVEAGDKIVDRLLAMSTGM